MRIFYITHTYSLEGGGGGEVFCTNFLKELSRRGHKIFVFTASRVRFPEKEKELGIEVFTPEVFLHHALHKFQYALLYPKAIKLARKFNPDIIHAQNDVFPAFIGSKVKNAMGVPLVAAVEYLSDKNVSLNLTLTYSINKLLLPKLNYDKIVSWSRYVIDNFFIPWKIPK